MYHLKPFGVLLNVKTLLKAYNAEIKLKSELGKETEFTIVIPIKENSKLKEEVIIK